MKKAHSVESAITLFEQSAIKHSEATLQGDYKTANKSYTLIVEAVSFLKEKNEVKSLNILLDHSNIGVKTWAASYILIIDESVGIKILQEVSMVNNILGFNAEMTLKEWQNGQLKL